jgi:mRNA-degrading endonuclease RelE of RelBE toxin-antitoxin system
MFLPLTFEEDPVFTKKALRLIGDDGIFAIQMFLYDRPDAGEIIPGSGGCRKLRWAAKGHGKRGGSRVIYYWITEDNRILLLDIYAKNECENPSPNRIRELKRKKP